LYLKRAELYETANELYKLLIPIFEKNRSYEQLAKSHGDLQDIFSKIINSIKTQSRLLGSYYRVGFYGKLFDELNGKECIYKEPKITRLGEIQDRLKVIFIARFKSEEKIRIITDSKAVDQKTLDPELAHIQITSVSPYFEPWELKDRLTYYDRNYNLNRFIFATPFTLSGKSQTDSVGEQHKRKTILTVENHFPYVKKRLLVIKKQELNLTPIENAIEAIESRTDSMLSELQQHPPNSKTLQSVLQGTLLLQVNVGPMEICKVFLGSPANYHPDQIEKLKQSFRDLLKASEDAVALNKTLIAADQVQFHNELEFGQGNLKTSIQPYL